MISFELSTEQEMAQSAARKMADSLIRPFSRSHSAFRDIPVAQPVTDEFLNNLSSLGLVQGVAHSASDGGSASRMVSAMILEQFAWGDANSAVAIAAPLAFVRAVAEQGSLAQKAAILPAFMGDGHCAAAIAAAEPGLNSKGLKVLSTELVATKEGYVLKGRKALVPFAKRCTHFLVIAREGGERRAVIVPASAPGVTVEDARYTVGCAASEMSDVVFEGVKLGSNAILGEGSGADIERLSSNSWAATSAILTGVTKAAYEFVSGYVKERKIGGEVLGTKQAVAIRIVDMFTDSESMRWMGWRAAGRLDHGQDGTKYARLAHGRAVDTAGWIVDEALQFMGGHGLMAEYPMEAWYRNAKTLSTFETAFGL